MSFSVRLMSDVVQAEAGTTTPLNIEIENKSDQTEQFELELQGLDPEWTALPVPTFTSEPSEARTEKVFLKPPRVSESVSGTYPFVVRVRSLSSGEAKTAQGILEVKPYHHISVDIHPKRGVVSPVSKEFSYDITVMNLGNSDHTLNLFATDPDDMCTFEFEQPQVHVGPGQQKTVVLNASTTSYPLLANNRLYGFAITARSLETSSVSANAQAQLEQRALLSIGSLIALLFIAGLVALWFAFWPKTPTLDVLTLDKTQTYPGQSVTVTWRSSHAKSVRLASGPNVLFTDLEANGSRVINLHKTGPMEITAIAFSGDRKSTPKSVSLNVEEPPQVPDPKILSYEISPKSVKLGQPFLVKYKLSDSVVKATLSPFGLQLDPRLDALQVTASLPGEQEVKLVAENGAGKKIERSIKIRVIEASQASIVVFKASQEVLEEGGGTVRLTWQMAGAVRGEIEGAGEKQEVDATSGFWDVTLTKTTTFTLTGYDKDGRIVRKTVRVRVKETSTKDPASPSEEPKSKDTPPEPRPDR